MNLSLANSRRGWVRAGLVVAAACSLAGCEQENPQRIQGYVEGEYVYVASPRSGALQELHVARGDRISAGALVFTLDQEPELAARNQARQQLAQARAAWEDAKKGKRPSEMESLEAQLAQAAATLKFSELELARLQRLRPSGAATDADLDRARAARDEDQARVVQLRAELETARLGARVDQVAAAEAEMHAREAALAQAEWNLAEKQQSAPQTSLVFDTLYREGEWVAAGRPVAALLPPENVKVRAFVPEARVAAIQMGDPVSVLLDGAPAPISGTVSFVSPQAEFTPPVIYSRESRQKLVFMIEIVFASEDAAKLHPGQPVDVELSAP
jgi:HlyD family secretion protein